MKTFLMVWSVFNYLLTHKLPRKAKFALSCSQYKKLLKTLKVAQKLPSTIYLCLVVRKCESITLVFLWCGRTVARAGGRAVGVRSRDYQIFWDGYLE